MSQRYNDNIKRPKLKGNQLGLSKIFSFCWEIEQRALGRGESTALVRLLSIRMHWKSCSIFPLKVATTLLSGSRKGAVELVAT